MHRVKAVRKKGAASPHIESKRFNMRAAMIQMRHPLDQKKQVELLAVEESNEFSIDMRSECITSSSD